jgi:hypothetical protein
LYDPDNVSFDLQDLDTQIDYKVVSNEQWNLVIQFNGSFDNKFDYKNSLLMLKFTWDNPNILVSQATAYLFTWINKNLSIGSLNQYRETHDTF